ncbi:MbtH-like protein [Streptomyces sp. YIM 121038]|uniref:MbtH family NRPS accessory protein n=1 Tax=Streptomyces sp. YIM 121038 TaxID=2136401 RepID=UPI00116312C4|nr:MbtH family NRPS accessory protein [Streptomyces sp. YIM 121038]QCX80617.1 MbtH-like protein [Streptomyces sp. YIM 121038]
MPTATGPAPIYKVVLNNEGRYAIRPSVRDLPPVWTDAGKSGGKTECLVFVWNSTRSRRDRAALPGPRAT